MNTRWKKAVSTGLCACLALSVFTGCSSDKGFDTKAAAITVNEDEVPAGVVKFATHHLQAQYESMYANFGYSGIINQDIYGTGSTLGETIKDQMVEEITHIVLAKQHMSDYGVSISEDQKMEISEAAAEFIADNDKEVLEKISADQETVEQYLELLTVQSLMQDAMGSDVDTEVSDEEAAQRRITYALFTPETEGESELESEEETEGWFLDESEGLSEEEYIPEETSVPGEAETASLTENDTAKTQAAAETEVETGIEAGIETEDVLDDAEWPAEAETGFEAAEEESETETEDPALAAAKRVAAAKAELLIARLLHTGEDFETAMKEIDPDATFNSITFGEGDADYRGELLEATDGLEDGTLVDYPVETDSGYYVVRLDTQLDREATDAEKEYIVEQRRSDRIQELYTEWEEAAEISTDDEVLAQIDFDFSLVMATEASTEAPAEEVTEAPAEEAAAEETAADAEAATEAPAEDAAAEETAADADEEATEAAAADEAATEAPAEDAEAVTEAVTE